VCACLCVLSPNLLNVKKEDSYEDAAEPGSYEKDS
jgi:hypothetical protein